MKVLLSFLKKYRLQCTVIIFVTLADVIGALMIPTISANMINCAVGGGNLREIVGMGSMMLVIALISGLMTVLGSWSCARLSAKLGETLRKAIYDKSLELSTSDFADFGTASMITRTLNDVSVIQQALVNFIQMILPVPVMCVLGVVMSFRINENMGILILAGTGAVLLVALLIIRKATSIFEKLQCYLDRMNTVLRENITGIRVIRAFNKEKYESGRMKNTFSIYAKSSIYANYLFAGLDSLATVTINIIIVMVVYMGGNAVGASEMKIGDITAVSEYAIWILMYVMMAQMTILMLPRAVTCVRRVQAVLNYEPEILDGMKERNISKSEEIISFHNVSFGFDDASEETLSNLSFTCRKGQTTAIIGSTGSGKTTIVKMVLRGYDVTKGRIALCGQDIREISQKELRQAISYVPQKSWLFSGTIAENLRYGNPYATDEELCHALKIAQADFVFTLPEGMDTVVAQGGINFSGGQRQRLAIARAIVKKAELYVFDDSFSALDFKTDAALRHELTKEVKNSAILVIAQRISTIRFADQIIVLNDGKIAGKGSHEELLRICPVYQAIVNSQMKCGE